MDNKKKLLFGGLAVAAAYYLYESSKKPSSSLPVGPVGPSQPFIPAPIVTPSPAKTSPDPGFTSHPNNQTSDPVGTPGFGDLSGLPASGTGIED